MRSLYSFLAVALLACPALAQTGPPPPSGPPIFEYPTPLPYSFAGTAVAVWNGTHAFVFGGGFGNGVVRFDPGTGQTQTMGAHLPGNLQGASAVTLGPYAYIFGGFNLVPVGSAYTTDPQRHVLRYEFATDQIVALPARTIQDRYLSGAATDGIHAYIFGGCYTYHAALGAGATWTCPISRFDPVTGLLVDLPAFLPSGIVGLAGAVAWDGQYFDYAGGCNCGFDGTLDALLHLNFNDTNRGQPGIARFDPSDLSVHVADAVLPDGRYELSAAAIDHRVYFFGGLNWTSNSASYHHDDIFVFDGLNDTLVQHDHALAHPSSSTLAVSTGRDVLIFGVLLNRVNCLFCLPPTPPVLPVTPVIPSNETTPGQALPDESPGNEDEVSPPRDASDSASAREPPGNATAAADHDDVPTAECYQACAHDLPALVGENTADCASMCLEPTAGYGAESLGQQPLAAEAPGSSTKTAPVMWAALGVGAFVILLAARRRREPGK